MTHYLCKKGITPKSAPMYLMVFFHHHKNPEMTINELAAHFTCHATHIARILDAMKDSAWLVQLSQIKSFTFESKINL